MIVLLPFHEGALTQATQWLEWVKELGGCKPHRIILMPGKALKDIEEQTDLARDSFADVEILRDAEGISGHPEGPNSFMRQTVWHIQTAGLGPVFNCEPDCIPRESGWLDKWEREYIHFGKPFMGEFRPASGVTPDYLTGCMVIPKDPLYKAPMLGRRGLSRDNIELAFDIVAASQILPQAHLTKFLQQEPKNPDGSSHTFPNRDSLKLLREGAVLFHPCKDGSLIERLREERTGVVKTDMPVYCSNGEIYNPPQPDKTEALLLARIAELEAEVASLKRLQPALRTHPPEQNKKTVRKRKPSPKRSEAMRQYWAKRKLEKAKA